MFDVTRLRDALYNTHPESGASVEYAQGIVVGVVSGMMAHGQKWQDAWATMYKALPKGFRLDCLPYSWRAYVIVVHRPTGRQYVLGRDYVCMTSEPVTGFDFQNPVETWEGYSVLSSPSWTSKHPASEFTAYWMY